MSATGIESAIGKIVYLHFLGIQCEIMEELCPCEKKNSLVHQSPERIMVSSKELIIENPVEIKIKEKAQNDSSSSSRKNTSTTRQVGGQSKFISNSNEKSSISTSSKKKRLYFRKEKKTTREKNRKGSQQPPEPPPIDFN